MRVLITGGFGYLGGRLAQFLATEAGYEILLGSRLHAESPPWLPQARVAQTQWDAQAGLEQVCAGVDAVVHLARMNAQDCTADPVAALEFNAVVTARLLRSAIGRGVKRFVYVSTAHVYASPLNGVITEETCPTSLHPYATSHRAGEDVVRAAHRRGEIEGIVVRLSNAYGAPAHKDANCWMLLLNNLCRQAVTARRMVLRSSGLERRDFITLTDACRAIGHLLDLPAEKLADGLFNLGGAWNPTLLEISLLLRKRAAQKLNTEIPFSSAPADAGEDAPSLEYCIDKLANTGFELAADRMVEMDLLLDSCLVFFGGSNHGHHRSQ